MGSNNPVNRQGRRGIKEVKPQEFTRTYLVTKEWLSCSALDLPDWDGCGETSDSSIGG